MSSFAEEIEVVTKTKKTLEALKLEAKQARYGLKWTLAIYLIAIAVISVVYFGEEIMGWFGNFHFRFGKAEDQTSDNE